MKTRRRISVRLSQEQSDRLHAHCQEAGYDISRTVRRALEVYMGAQSGSGTAGAAQRPRLAPLEQILPLTSKYLAWGDGDLRQHLKKLMWDLMAASWVCKKLYPRTPGMVELYEALRPLAHFFGVEERDV